MKRNNLFWLIGGLIIIVAFLLPIFSADYRAATVGLIQDYPYFAPLIVIIFRFIGVVAAPLPGAPIAFASMAILPWPQALLYNFIGAELGAVAAFLIARRFREPVVARFASLNKIHAWQEKVSKSRQLWTFTGLRAASLIAFDFISYAAGLTKLPFRTFLLATLIIDIPANFMFFYFGGLAVSFSVFLFGAFAVIFMVGLALWNRKRVQGKI